VNEDGEVARANLVQVRLRGEVVAAAPIWSVCRRGYKSAVAMMVRGTSFAEAWWCASDLLHVMVRWWLLVRAKMDENEGADSWLRYYSGNGDDKRLRCCHEMVRAWRSCGAHGG